MRDAIFDLYCAGRGSFKTSCGIKLPLDLGLSPDMRRAILSGEYEKNELAIVSATLEDNDRVLECGTGLGLLSAYCARRLGGGRVRTFEANPYMLPIINQTFKLNDVSLELMIGAIGPTTGQIEFHVRRNFWASSSHAGRRDGSEQTITVPTRALHDAILATQPTYLLIDIEGAEENLIGCSDLPGVKKIMMEIHHDLIGAEAVKRLHSWLFSLGFDTDIPLLWKRDEVFFYRS